MAEARDFLSEDADSEVSGDDPLPSRPLELER